MNRDPPKEKQVACTNVELTAAGGRPPSPVFGRDSVWQNRRNRRGKGGPGCPGEAVGLGDRGGSLEPAARVPGTGSVWLCGWS